MSNQTILSIAAITLTAVVSTSSVQAGSLPDCSSHNVLHRVDRAISKADRNVVKSGDPVIEITRPHQHKLRTHGPRRVEQRYCHATGHTETGRKKRIYYLIEADAGFSGLGYGVEACIPGRDPWKIHGAHCRSVR